MIEGMGLARFPSSATAIGFALTVVSGGLPASLAQDAGPIAAALPSLVETKLDIQQFQVVERDSGPINYYQKVIDDPEGPMLRARYRFPLETVVLGLEIPGALRSKVKRVHWRWRVLAFPTHGNECEKGKGDSAAAVLVTFKRGLRLYILKYIWSTEAPKGAVCDKRRNPFLVRNTIVLESGGPTNVWIDEEIDPRAAFVSHFGGTGSDVPDLVGLGVFTDGDQTQSPSQSDYAQFSVSS